MLASNVVYLRRQESQGSDMRNRKLLVQRLHATYQRNESLKEWICFYCGSPADTEDHCPPLSLAESFPGEDRVLLRCCRLCNSLLGARFLLTPYARAEYLIKKYAKRWHKDLDMPNWSDEEIEELTGQLKREIIRGMKRKERASSVLSNLQRHIDAYLETL